MLIAQLGFSYFAIEGVTVPSDTHDNREQAAPREAAVEEIRREYARRTDRFDQFADARHRDDHRIWCRTMASYQQMLDRCGLLPLGARDVLDVGCGRMEWLEKCRNDWGHDVSARLAGLDLMADRIEEGRRRHPDFQLECGSADALPWPDGSFDLVHQSMLLTSVLDEPLRRGIISEMIRVTRPGGHVLWYDFVWNPVNRAARGIGLRELKSCFADWTVSDRRRVTMPPPLSRPLGRLFPPLVSAIEAVRVLNLWELVLLRKPN
ncbi:MAG: class I SAM-dependent methyltransferase [Pirellulales bacterium]